MNILLSTTVLAGISSLASLCLALNVLFTGGMVVWEFGFNPVFGKVSFCVDPLSAFFLVVISIMGFLAVFYSNGYLKPYIEKGKKVGVHILFLLLLIFSMELVVTCTNAILFLIFWEIMSLSSFFLVIFENDKKDVLRAGIKYLVFMHVSVLFIIASFALSQCHGSASIVFLLAFIGFGTKAGFVPFHNWLPEAHPAAPSHISAIMSGVMIKTGIYGILRIILSVGVPEKWLGYLVLIISAVSGLYGVLYAITQHDLKRLLAYSSIENIGIIGIGIGIGMLGLSYGNQIVAFLGFAGGILHILNHSIFKELLFLAAGNVYLKTHTRDIESLGGLIKRMPLTAVLFLIASVAICGLPPFNGFVSEFLIYFGMIKGLCFDSFYVLILLMFALAVLALIGTMAILCFTKVFSVVFLGAPRSEYAQIEKTISGRAVILPMCILALFIFLIGMFPQYAVMLIASPVFMFTGTVGIAEAVPVFDIMETISLVSIIFITTVGILAGIKCMYMKKHTMSFETWGCGYDRLDARMQYTASSYAKPFVGVLGPLFKKVINISRPKKLFPHHAHYESSMLDIEEACLLEPVLKGNGVFLSKFEKIQNGNLQHYIKIGLGFLVLIILGLFWFK